MSLKGSENPEKSFNARDKAIERLRKNMQTTSPSYLRWAEEKRKIVV